MIWFAFSIISLSAFSLLEGSAHRTLGDNLSWRMLIQDFDEYFSELEGTSSPTALLFKYQRLCFDGELRCPSLRPLFWRLFLGCISWKGKTAWQEELKLARDKYYLVKTSIVPKASDVSIDPLSALVEKNAAWDLYYKTMELSNFIRGDLERLYVSGIHHTYFEDKAHQEILLNVLLVWALQHPQISYRQGMHEIVGPILFVLEAGMVF